MSLKIPLISLGREFHNFGENAWKERTYFCLSSSTNTERFTVLIYRKYAL